jgi:hypothetical protein
MNARQSKAKLKRAKHAATSSRRLCSGSSEARISRCKTDTNPGYHLIPRTRRERIALCVSFGFFLSLFAQGTLETPQDLFYMLALVAYCAVLTYWIPTRALDALMRTNKEQQRKQRTE